MLGCIAMIALHMGNRCSGLLHIEQQSRATWMLPAKQLYVLQSFQCGHVKQVTNH